MEVERPVHLTPLPSNEIAPYFFLALVSMDVLSEKSTEEVAQYWIGVPQLYEPEYGDCSVTIT